MNRRGQVLGHQALLSVAVIPPGGRSRLEIEFVIDTGFIGYLTLPPAAVAALGLPFLRRMPANLADDSTINLSVYALLIVWDGEDREVEVLATGRRPLLGTLMLDGTDLRVQWADGGRVDVEAL